VLPKQAAIKLVDAKNETDRQAAILEGQFFINGEPFLLYLSDQSAVEASKQLDKNAPASPAANAGTKNANGANAGNARNAPQVVVPAQPARDTSPEALAKIQANYEKIVGLVVRETEAQAHYVTYAPPAVVPFRKGAYLEFSVTTPLSATAAGSRYKMAALAFDDHIAHLIRPMMAYFKGDLEFDGIAFSTTIHLPERQDAAAAQKTPAVPPVHVKEKPSGKPPSDSPEKETSKPSAPSGSAELETVYGSEAVEFFFPVEALRCYESYECTGQQLLDGGSVLINGERVSLDLQIAESGVR